MNKLLKICLLIVAIGLIAIFVFKVSIGNILTWGILLLCPLMHLLMMKGHGDHKENSDTKNNSKSCH